MAQKFLIGLLLIIVSGCSSTPRSAQSLRDEELSKNFVAEGIEVTSSGCSGLGKVVGKTCAIVAIESTSTAPSNGGSVVNRKNALDAACAYAMGNAARFMGQGVQSSTSIDRSGRSQETNKSTEDRGQGSDKSVVNETRKNENDTTTVVSNTIRQSASRYMKGWAPVKQEVVGPQEVSCTMKWSLMNERLLNSMPGK